MVKEVEHEKEKARLTIVEAENERRAKELEEARQFQLSMLPKKLPEIADLEIAAYMKPATEVGGDYYDFHVGEGRNFDRCRRRRDRTRIQSRNGRHGDEKFIQQSRRRPDIPDNFRQISQSLKAMNLRGLFMAMTLIKLKDNQFEDLRRRNAFDARFIARRAKRSRKSAARRAFGKYDEFQLSQAGNSFCKQAMCVMVMSDGFPEMFNAENEMLGFEKAGEVLPRNRRQLAAGNH